MSQLGFAMLAMLPGTDMDRLSLEQVCQVTDRTPRQIRLYISRGAVAPPIGRTSSARYTRKHLRQIATVKRGLANGLTVNETVAVRHDIAQRASTANSESGLESRGYGSETKMRHLRVSRNIFIVSAVDLSTLELRIYERLKDAATLGLKEKSDIEMALLRADDERSTRKGKLKPTK